MNLTPEQLSAHGFVKLETLKHADLVPFVQHALALRTYSRLAYLIINLALLAAAGAAVVVAHARGASVDFALTRIAQGITATVVLIPVHEGIHVLAYRLVGATHTAIVANWRRFVFYAVADRFVASAREFLVIALAPFVVITVLLLLAALVVPPSVGLLLLGTLITHTACCSGDFALLAWFEANRARAPVTFDDHSLGLTEFWGRPLP